MYDATDQRFWSYRMGGNGSLWTLRGLNNQVLREYRTHLAWANYVDSILRGTTLLATAPSVGAGGAVNHLHTDLLGTPRLITNSVGSIAGFHAYYPFGEEMASTFSSTYTDRQRFLPSETLQSPTSYSRRAAVTFGAGTSISPPPTMGLLRSRSAAGWVSERGVDHDLAGFRQPIRQPVELLEIDRYELR